jgi:hypothetical protein
MPTKTEIAALVKEYNSIRNDRLKLDEASKKLKVREDSILDNLTAAKVTSGLYGAYQVTVDTKPVARITDWHNFHAYIRENNALDMLTKHITQSAIMARVNEGELVPGVVCDDRTTYKFSLA